MNMCAYAGVTKRVTPVDQTLGVVASGRREPRRQLGQGLAHCRRDRDDVGDLVAGGSLRIPMYKTLRAPLSRLPMTCSFRGERTWLSMTFSTRSICRAQSAGGSVSGVVRHVL